MSPSCPASLKVIRVFSDSPKVTQVGDISPASLRKERVREVKVDGTSLRCSTS